MDCYRCSEKNSLLSLRCKSCGAILRPDKEEGVLYLEKVLAESRESNNARQALYCRLLLAEWELNHRTEIESKYLIDPANFSDAQKLDDPAAAARALNMLATLYSHSANLLPTAIPLLTRAIIITQQTANRVEEAYTHYIFARVARGLGQYDVALEHYQKAREINEELGNTEEIGRCLSHLGSLYVIFGKNKEAIQLLRQSLHILAQYPKEVYYQANLVFLSIASASAGKVPQALAYSAEAQELCEDINSLALHYGWTLRCASVAHALAGTVEHLEIALDMARVAHKIASTYDDQVGLIACLYHEARALYLLKRFPEALEISSKAIDLLTIDFYFTSEDTSVPNIIWLHAQILFRNNRDEEGHSFALKAEEVLRKEANKIKDPVWRNNFLERIHWHNQIQQGNLTGD